MPLVQKRKLGILQFTSLAGMDTDSVLLLYLIAAADPQDPISRCNTGLQYAVQLVMVVQSDLS